MNLAVIITFLQQNRIIYYYFRIKTRAFFTWYLAFNALILSSMKLSDLSIRNVTLVFHQITTY